MQHQDANSIIEKEDRIKSHLTNCCLIPQSARNLTKQLLQKHVDNKVLDKWKKAKMTN